MHAVPPCEACRGDGHLACQERGTCMSKHTPGPWVPYAGTSGVFIVSNQAMGYETVAHALALDDGARPAKVVEANARLIAAAPELLEACEMALRLRLDDDSEVADAVRAAIAKAKGE